MTAKIRIFHYILIDQKLHFPLCIIHKSHTADGSRCNVQILLHILRFCKRKSGRAYLCRQILCLEWLVTRHQKQIKVCFLSIAKEQVLADCGSISKCSIDLFTGFHCHDRFVIRSDVGDMQTVQYIVNFYFFFFSKTLH